jgi:RNA polymerase sigma-70 factor (ECF subfamily)
MGTAVALDEPLTLDDEAGTGRHGATSTSAPDEIRKTAALGDWLARVAAREDTAMRQLHGAVSTQVRRVVGRIVSDPYLADEVVGDCFCQVWREASRFDSSRGSVASWVSTIARSRALDAVRRRKSRASREEPLTEEHESCRACPDESPYARLEASQRNRGLNDALARIDPIQRQLLSLAFGGGMSHEQVAEHCGLALGTVKSHIRRGLAQMHRHCVRAGLRPSL